MRVKCPENATKGMGDSMRAYLPELPALFMACKGGCYVSHRKGGE